MKAVVRSSGSGKSHNSKGCGEFEIEFQMPLHYPRYTRADYETMPEWRLDCLLKQYGLPIIPEWDLQQKRNFAIGAFLWPH